jgi:hypothetical protein
LAPLPIYDANGARCLQAFLRQLPAYPSVVVTYADYRVVTRHLTTATPVQWEWVQWVRRQIPHALVHLRERELICHQMVCSRKQLQEARRELIDAAYEFLRRCYKCDLLNEDAFKKALSSIGTTVDPADLAR